MIETIDKFTNLDHSPHNFWQEIVGSEYCALSHVDSETQNTNEDVPSNLLEHHHAPEVCYVGLKGINGMHSSRGCK